MYSFIGAGAVVLKDVPDYAMMVGNPAIRKGWMCVCGTQISFNAKEGTCKNCNRKYIKLGSDKIVEVNP